MKASAQWGRKLCNITIVSNVFAKPVGTDSHHLAITCSALTRSLSTK